MMPFCQCFARRVKRTNSPRLRYRNQEDRQMTRNTTSQQTSRNLPGQKPRIDKERNTREAIVEDAGETEDKGRDLVHGDGGTIDLPTKPGDLSKDD
jgi:hypothetical protein